MTDPPPADLIPPPPEQPTADFAPPDPAAGREPDDEPYLKDSVDAQALYDRAVAEAAGGDEPDAVVHLLRASKLAEAAREWYLTAAACHRLGDIFLSPRPPYDLQRALRMYQRAVAAYETCGLFDDARRLAYRVAAVKLWRGRELGLSARLRAELFAYWLSAGFGYRPGRVVGCAAAIVLGFAVLYWAAGGLRHPDGAAAGGWWDAVYFSGVTFSTVGYGDLLPAPHVRMAAMCEGALGMFLMSFFVVVLANRLRH